MTHEMRHKNWQQETAIGATGGDFIAGLIARIAN
jgi:hypothetical protein